MSINAEPRVVILGGGFAGLRCARALRRAPVRITLIDRRNHHLFQPLLYQVATASLSPADIAAPIRHVLRRQRNVQVWMGEVRDIDVGRRLVTLDDGVVEYDFLVVATGATHSYFGHDEWASFAPGLKTIEDALEIRRRFLVAFEAAEREADPAARARHLTFVIIGAGPTGAELAGAMAEIARTVIPSDFRAVDTASARIVLVEGVDRVLPTFPEKLSSAARRQLERLGVEVRTGVRVNDVDGNGVRLEGGERIEAQNVVWAAGVAASPVGARLGVPLDRAGRVLVEPDLSVPGHPEVFVAGDLARVEQDGRGVSGVAPAAMQMGTYVGRTIRRELVGRPREPFRYLDKGTLATIGRGAAVADLRGVMVSGPVAWLLWVVIHIFYLIGFRNRLLVLMEWGWAYLTYQRGMRLITGESRLDLEIARAPSD
ncbi:MAG TPA: NAD(P)/FAD-dependent oxidoreductase [Longimicrobiales bacterium]|nr:NAD(P)/FAD-dependent oxidoreductase [Longimicrobiales bacterium]